MLCKHKCHDRLFIRETEDAARSTRCNRHDLEVSKHFAKCELLGQQLFVCMELCHCLTVDCLLNIYDRVRGITCFLRLFLCSLWPNFLKLYQSLIRQYLGAHTLIYKSTVISDIVWHSKKIHNGKDEKHKASCVKR